jgi:predicted nuclease of predicted toxin-antitoxin system
MELRFHLDESVDHAVARGLIERGIDPITTTDAGLIGAADTAQLDHAVGERRVLVTHDRDFLRLASQSAEHFGIAYCPPGHRTIGQIILRLVHLWRTSSVDEMRGRVEFL